MQIFPNIPKEELGTTFTHYGWFFGVVPVYVGNVDSDEPILSARNWCPEFVFDIVEVMCGLAISMMPEDSDPMYPIKITGTIKSTTGL